MILWVKMQNHLSNYNYIFIYNRNLGLTIPQILLNSHLHQQYLLSTFSLDRRSGCLTADQTGFLYSNRFDFGLDNFQINLSYKVVTKVTVKFIAPSLAFLCIPLWQPSIVNHCFPLYYNGAINYIQIYWCQLLSSKLK